MLKRRITKRRVAIFVLIILVVAGLLIWKYLTPYAPAQEAETALISSGGVTVEQNDNWISFEPSITKGASIIFYPGALVKPEAYSPLAKSVAAAGHPFYIAKMPFNLAVTKGMPQKRLFVCIRSNLLCWVDIHLGVSWPHVTQLSIRTNWKVCFS